MNNRLVYTNPILNLVKGSGADNNPFLLESLRKKFNFDMDNPPISMSYDQFLEMADYLRQAKYSHYTEDKGWEMLGYDATLSFFSGIGKVTKVAFANFQVETALNVFIQTRQTNFPFGRHEIDHAQPGYFIYHCYAMPVRPYLFIGQIRAGLEVAGVTDATFEFRQPNPEETIIEVRYTPKFSNTTS
jgi:Protein of unknown function (DUF2378)